MTTPQPLADEQEALVRILNRLMNEESSLDSLCKHVPRVVSVAANLARIQAGLIAANEPDAHSELRKALAELNAEIEEQEEDTW